MWCHGLTERISEPMEKLRLLGEVITEREEFKDVQKLQQSINQQILDFEQVKIKEWIKEVETQTEEKLEKTLLCKAENEL